MVPIPENLPLLIGLEGPRAAVVERILKGQTDLKTNLLDLSKFWRIRVWFNQEIDIRVQTHVVKKEIHDGTTFRYYKSHVHTNVHTFNCISTAASGGELLYGTKHRARHGFYFPNLDMVVKYEPVLNDPRKRNREFKSYKDFKKKFDPFYITESEIQRLWNGTSSQHGGKYLPSDFHRIGPRGKKVLESFLKFFKGITSTDRTGYHTNEYGTCLHERYNSWHQLGRDIKIEHNALNGFVFYSSEFHGCGNGRYGLLANKKEFLHIEDD